MGPGGEGLGAAGPEVCGGVVVSAAGEHIGDLIMGGEEALNLPRRLEPLHDPLSSSGRLMGVFGPVIEALVLPMLDPGHDFPLGSGDRGRDVHYCTPPAQNRTCGFPAYGSHLGCLTAKRSLGQGWRMRGLGRKSAASASTRFHVKRSF